MLYPLSALVFIPASVSPAAKGDSFNRELPLRLIALCTFYNTYCKRNLYTTTQFGRINEPYSIKRYQLLADTLEYTITGVNAYGTFSIAAQRRASGYHSAVLSDSHLIRTIERTYAMHLCI